MFETEQGIPTGGIIYKAINKPDKDGSTSLKWKSPMFMPEKYDRIFRRMTNIKAERLQDIREDDAQKEGVEFYCNVDGIIHREAFKRCIIDIQGPEIWEEKLWVWAYEFKEIEGG